MIDPQVGLPTLDEIHCACGADAVWSAADAWGQPRTQLANGSFCLDCEAFYCLDCAAKARLSDAAADDDLCPACNGTWTAAGFGAA